MQMIRKVQILSAIMFCLCSFQSVHAQGIYAVSGPMLYTDSADCIKIKKIKIDIFNKRLSIEYEIENICRNHPVKFYALTKKFTCSMLAKDDVERYVTPDFSEFSVFVNNKAIATQHTFIAKKNDIDITDKLLKDNLGVILCSKIIPVNEQAKIDYKELIDDSNFIVEDDNFMPAWDIQHKYTWNTGKVNNKTKFTMQINYNILEGSEYTPADSVTNRLTENRDYTIGDPELPDIPYPHFSKKFYKLLGADKAYEFYFLWAVIPLGIADIPTKMNVPLTIKYHDQETKNVQRASKVYAGMKLVQPHNGFILKYGQHAVITVKDISLPEELYIISLMRSWWHDKTKK
jgi:hypothetical protein